MCKLTQKDFSREQFKRHADNRRCRRCCAQHISGDNTREVRRPSCGWKQPGNVGGRKSSAPFRPPLEVLTISASRCATAQQRWHQTLFQVAQHRSNAGLHTIQAVFGLGNNHRDGRGTPKNVREAAWFYRMAACSGHAEAQVELGIMYLAGTGIKKDLVIAARSFQRAANQGHVDGIRHLASMHADALKSKLGPSTPPPPLLLLPPPVPDVTPKLADWNDRNGHTSKVTHHGASAPTAADQAAACRGLTGQLKLVRRALAELPAGVADGIRTGERAKMLAGTADELLNIGSQLMTAMQAPTDRPSPKLSRRLASTTTPLPNPAAGAPGDRDTRCRSRTTLTGGTASAVLERTRLRHAELSERQRQQQQQIVTDILGQETSKHALSTQPTYFV